MNNPSEVFPESDIILTRGDTCQLKWQRLDEEGEPITDIPDKMYFTVKKGFKTQNPIVQKTLEDMELGDDDYWHIVIAPDETDGLAYGEYVFDLEVINAGIKQTIAMGTFTVGCEVTFARNEV